MAFDNDYPNRKDRRRPYRGPASADRHCRPHGLCDWCRLGRLFKHRRRQPAPDAGEMGGRAK